MISVLFYDIMYDIIYHIILSAGLSGGTCALPQQPDSPNPVQSFNVKTDLDLQGCGLVLYARPQFFFNCSLCPKGAKGFSNSHKEVSLVYFSTFEPIEQTPDNIMQQAGVPMLYDSASNPRLPCLYI